MASVQVDRVLRAATLRHKPISVVQREILRAIELHGSLTQPMANRHGWLTHGGLPIPEFQELIDRMLVAPRMITAHPIKVGWELREKAQHAATLAQIEKTARAEGWKEHATGGFQLKVRNDLHAIERKFGVRR